MLRSLKSILGFRIAAADGDIGHVDDLVIDTRNWLPGKHVALTPAHAKRVEGLERRILVDR